MNHICIKKLTRQLFLSAVLVIVTAIPAFATAQGNEAQIAKEYFIQQSTEEALLITVNAFEAEFESRISGQNAEVLLLSGIPGSRLVPVFQYVHVPENDRQLDIRITSDLHTRRSEFSLELTRLTVWDGRSNSVSQAYQLLSFGCQTGTGSSKSSWTVKIDSLLNAGKLFQRFGMKEMRLWSNYLAAHLIQFQLHDHSIVYTMTREILADLRGARLQKLELATMQLQSAALIGLKSSGSIKTPAGGEDPVQAALLRTAQLAQSMGYHFELAHALNASGTAYAEELSYTKALERFQQAVRIADSVGDSELATGIRESIVNIHAVLGNSPASSEVLQQIETQLIAGGDKDELALNLLAQGRLHISSMRYRQALEILFQAIDYQNNSAIRKQINFELAKIYYETGHPDEAIAYLQLAGIYTSRNQQTRTNSMIDMARGLWIMANIHRARGEYELMQKARSAQGRHQPSRPHFLYDQGLDALASTGTNHRRAQSIFRQSHTAAMQAGQTDLQHLSLLQYCALGHKTDAVRALCSRASIKKSYEWLLTGGVPRFAMQAMYLWTQILANDSRHSEAIAAMDHLTDEMHLLRHSLPGVLGAWYWEQHEEMFEFYLQLLVTKSANRSRDDASVSLLALSKIRYIERYSDADFISITTAEDTDLLRSQLARRSYSAPGQLQSALNNEINQGMGDIRKAFGKKFEFLSKAGMQKYLKSLANDETLLTYHISPASALVWVGHKGRVQWRKISNPAYIYAALQEARQGLANIGISSFDSKMDALGKRLLAPVANLLTETVYWVPAGPLLGFPLDALRIEGHYLIEQHQLVNLVSFPANLNPHISLQAAETHSTFLAGHPLDYSGDYAARLNTSSEIQIVANIFIGPGLHIIQGTALLPDEFQTEKFQQANLVHLSMPGVIDLSNPEHSSLELSGSEDGPGRASLGPVDIQSQQVVARLVFLSATRMKNVPSSGFINRPGLISDFVDAGAQSVIANMWASNGRAAEAFTADFYHQLEVSGNIANSLSDAKRQYIITNRNNGLYDWAGFQLFID